MPVLTFPCPKCFTAMGFEYADYDFREWAKSHEDNFEKLVCRGCKKELKVVPWIAVFDEEKGEAVTFV